ncbi:hypothetical protein IAT38_000530 [Cryptococcus sp. DSM 104549]
MATPSPAPSSSRNGSPTPPLPKLDRSQYAAYASFLSDLHTESNEDLSWRLTRRWEKQPARGNDSEDDSLISDEEGEAERGSRGSREQSGPRRVDGPRFTPAYQGTSAALRKRRRKKDSQVPDDGRATSWPVGLASQGTPPSLEEVITSFASHYIRLHNLSLPSGATTADRELDDDNPLIPDDLVASTTVFLNETLVRLAGARPPKVRKKRSEMRPMDWVGVMDLASLDRNTRTEVRAANTRLQTMYGDDGPDILAHRLDLLQQLSQLRDPEPISTSLYASAIPKPPARQHLSKAEAEERAERRKAREEKRQAKEEEQEAKKQARLTRKEGKRQERRERDKLRKTQ